MPGPRTARTASSTINKATPTNSANTPTLLILASKPTPAELITVLKTMSAQPNSTALQAASPLSAAKPISWKRDEIWGKVICKASATAASVTTNEAKYTQPAIQPIP